MQRICVRDVDESKQRERRHCRCRFAKRRSISNFTGIGAGVRAMRHTACNYQVPSNQVIQRACLQYFTSRFFISRFSDLVKWCDPVERYYDFDRLTELYEQVLNRMCRPDLTQHTYIIQYITYNYNQAYSTTTNSRKSTLQYDLCHPFPFNDQRWP